jgi:hypothetical protein
MIPFPTAELKQIELKVIQDCHAKIKTDQDKKELMLQKILEAHEINDDVEFFKNAYVFNVIDYTKKISIDKFLRSEGKGLDDYLKLLSKEELATLTEPYKQKLALEAKAIIDEYFIKKDEQSLKNMAFYEKGKEIFFSA